MSDENDVGVIAPQRPLWPVEPQPYYELQHVYVQDIGHEQEAYYKLGWHCISRHDRFALLCNDSVDQPLKFLIMEMTA